MGHKYQIYLISDSTGETLDRIFLALKSQFENFNYDKKIPLSNSVIDTLNFKPKLVERKKITEKLIQAINEINSLSN